MVKNCRHCVLCELFEGWVGDDNCGMEGVEVVVESNQKRVDFKNSLVISCIVFYHSTNSRFDPPQDSHHRRSAAVARFERV